MLLKVRRVISGNVLLPQRDQVFLGSVRNSFCSDFFIIAGGFSKGAVDNHQTIIMAIMAT